MIWLLLLFPAVLLLAAIVSLVGARGALPRNHFFGIRVPASLVSDEAWVASHRAAIRPAWIGFAISAVVCVVAMLEPDSWFHIGKYVLVVVFLVTIVLIFRAASRGARAVAA